MNLELDAWHHLLNVYTKFEIDISKHEEKMPGKLWKTQNSKNTIFARNGTYVEKYTAGHLCAKFEGFMKPWLQKISLAYFGL